MTKRLFTVFFIISLSNILFAQPHLCSQPEQGPGGCDYIYDKVIQHNHAQQADGFWLFEPNAPTTDSANIVVFIHGYAVIEPMVYGAWIKHLVRKGNIVIFPRYQKTQFKPMPKHFAQNTATGIKKALEELKNEGHVKAKLNNIIYAGHSYGAAIAGYFGVKYAEYELPKPKGLLLCQPGTGKFKGGRLDSYEELEKDIKLIVFVGKDDRIVGDKLARKIFSTADVDDQNLFLHYKDKYGSEKVKATHVAPCAVDEEFDYGRRNLVTRVAIRRSRTNVVDFFGYWKALDALIDCSFYKQNCRYAFGNTPEQRCMGNWSDEKPVNQMVIFQELEN